MTGADKPSCLTCRFFAGRSRDRFAALFRQRKGYCDNPAHPWGVWNVVQSIDKPQRCALFEAAPEAIVQQRREAAKKLIQGRKDGNHR